MLEMIVLCSECGAYDDFLVRKNTRAKSVFKRAYAIHRKSAPKCKTKNEDLGVMSYWEAHCGGLIE